MKARSSAMFALGVVTALTLGGTVAYAASGNSLIIGQANQGEAVTRLSSPRGTPLALLSKPGSAPLAVNRRVKVANLNADELDGTDSLAFALKSGRTGIIVGSTKDGDGILATAVCPRGTIATGGGGFEATAGGHLVYSGPVFNGSTGKLVPNSWEVLSDTTPVGFVVCYNPRGAVPGAVGTLAPSSKTGASLSALQARYSK